MNKKTTSNGGFSFLRKDYTRYTGAPEKVILFLKINLPMIEQKQIANRLQT